MNLSMTTAPLFTVVWLSVIYVICLSGFVRVSARVFLHGRLARRAEMLLVCTVHCTTHIADTWQISPRALSTLWIAGVSSVFSFRCKLRLRLLYDDVNDKALNPMRFMKFQPRELFNTIKANESQR